MLKINQYKIYRSPICKMERKMNNLKKVEKKLSTIYKASK